MDVATGRFPIIGHEWALTLLARAIKTGHLSHAYLFTGPAQVGKMTLARTFAQALVCERQTGLPCGECRTCLRVLGQRYPDLQFIAALKNNIQIDQVRAIQTDAALAPLEGKYRIFVIREIERATPPAANALLKTLEEPPSQVVLLLTSARRDQVLPTILSRCQVVPLRPLPLEQVADALQTHWAVDPERATLLARLSGGRLGWAVDAQTDPALWEHRARTLDDLLALTTGSASTPWPNIIGRLAYAEKLSRQADDLATVLGLWATWWRDVLLIQQGAGDVIINLDRRAQLHQLASLYRADQIERALVDVIRTARRIKANVNPRLALDVLMLRLPMAEM